MSLPTKSLTPAGRAALRSLVDGGYRLPLVQMDGRAVGRLAQQGFVRQKLGERGLIFVVITDAGRAALAESDGAA